MWVQKYFQHEGINIYLYTLLLLLLGAANKAACLLGYRGYCQIRRIGNSVLVSAAKYSELDVMTVVFNRTQKPLCCGVSRDNFWTSSGATAQNDILCV